MKLKIRTTAGAALGVAAMAAALSIGCGTLLNLGLPRILIVTGSVFTVMYLTARFCFNLFVRYRIKPIYQVLLSKNVKTHELPPAGDLVEEIQDELNLWAEKNAQEIARLKENERYRKEFLGNVSHEIKTRSLCGKETGIGGKSFKIFLHHLFQSLSASDKGYEHEDSPEHAECGQQASCFISCDGNEDFLTGIHVYFHNLNLL